MKIYLTQNYGSSFSNEWFTEKKEAISSAEAWMEMDRESKVFAITCFASPTELVALLNAAGDHEINLGECDAIRQITEVQIPKRRVARVSSNS